MPHEIKILLPESFDAFIQRRMTAERAAIDNDARTMFLVGLFCAYLDLVNEREPRGS